MRVVYRLLNGLRQYAGCALGCTCTQSPLVAANCLWSNYLSENNHILMKFHPRARAWQSKVGRSNYATIHRFSRNSIATTRSLLLRTTLTPFFKPKTSITTRVCSCVLRARPSSFELKVRWSQEYCAKYRWSVALLGIWRQQWVIVEISVNNSHKHNYLVMFMTVVHTYFYIVVDTQRGCHTLKVSYRSGSLWQKSLTVPNHKDLLSVQSLRPIIWKFRAQ